MRVEVTPSGTGQLMLGSMVLADFEDPALARAFLAVARAAGRVCNYEKNGRARLRGALARLDRVSAPRKP